MKKNVVVAVLALVAANSIGVAAPKGKKIVVALNDNVTNVTVTDESAASRKAVPAKRSAVIAKNQKKVVITENKTATPAASVTSVPVAKTSSSKAAVAASAGTISTPIAKAVVAVKKSPFSLKVRNYNAVNMDAAENSAVKPDNEVRAWDRFNLTYSFTDNVSFSLMPQIWHTWFGDRDRNQDQGPAMQQPYAGYLDNTGLILADSKIAALKGGLNLDGFLRYDIPTSELSQKNGSAGEVWANVGLGREFGKFEIKYQEMGRYYIQSKQTSTLTAIDKATGLEMQKQNNSFRLYSLLDIAYNITKKLSITLETGFINKFTHPDDRAETLRSGTRTDVVVMNPDITYAFNDIFSMSAGLYEESDMAAMPSTGYIPLSMNNGSGGSDQEIYLMNTIRF